MNMWVKFEFRVRVRVMLRVYIRAVKLEAKFGLVFGVMVIKGAEI